MQKLARLLNGEVTVGDVCAVLGCSRAFASRLLMQLEHDGQVKCIGAGMQAPWVRVVEKVEV